MPMPQRHDKVKLDVDKYTTPLDWLITEGGVHMGTTNKKSSKMMSLNTKQNTSNSNNSYNVQHNSKGRFKSSQKSSTRYERKSGFYNSDSQPTTSRARNCDQHCHGHRHQKKNKYDVIHDEDLESPKHHRHHGSSSTRVRRMKKSSKPKSASKRLLLSHRLRSGSSYASSVNYLAEELESGNNYRTSHSSNSLKYQSSPLRRISSDDDSIWSMDKADVCCGLCCCCCCCASTPNEKASYRLQRQQRRANSSSQSSLVSQSREDTWYSHGVGVDETFYDFDDPPDTNSHMSNSLLHHDGTSTTIAISKSSSDTEVGCFCTAFNICGRSSNGKETSEMATGESHDEILPTSMSNTDDISYFRKDDISCATNNAGEEFRLADDLTMNGDDEKKIEDEMDKVCESALLDNNEEEQSCTDHTAQENYMKVETREIEIVHSPVQSPLTSPVKPALKSLEVLTQCEVKEVSQCEVKEVNPAVARINDETIDLSETFERMDLEQEYYINDFRKQMQYLSTSTIATTPRSQILQSEQNNIEVVPCQEPTVIQPRDLAQDYESLFTKIEQDLASTVTRDSSVQRSKMREEQSKKSIRRNSRR